MLIINHHSNLNHRQNQQISKRIISISSEKTCDKVWNMRRHHQPFLLPSIFATKHFATKLLIQRLAEEDAQGIKTISFDKIAIYLHQNA